MRALPRSSRWVQKPAYRLGTVYDRAGESINCAAHLWFVTNMGMERGRAVPPAVGIELARAEIVRGGM